MTAIHTQHNTRRDNDGSSEPSLMQAIVQDRYGTAEVLRLETIERPTIADDEVLIKVYAAGIDRGTEHLMTGRPYLVRLVATVSHTYIERLVEFIDNGQVSPTIGQRFALGDVPEAKRQLAAGNAAGKLLIEVRADERSA